MPLLNGTVASTGLPKQPNMSGFLSNQTLQYGGAYFTYQPRAKDGAELLRWTNSASLLDGRSPLSHLPGSEGPTHVIYRQNSGSSDEGLPHPSSVRHTPLAPGFGLYARSPRMSSPTAATSAAVRQPRTAGENPPPAPDASVHLAAPKPVYGQNSACCHELGCVVRHRYGGEQTFLCAEYERDWVPPDHDGPRSPVQSKERDALLQQERFRFELGAEQMRRAAETYSPGRARTLPPVMEPSYGGYPRSPTHTLFASLSELGQSLSPRGYPSLYPSPSSHEHMTSELYQGSAPMSKYGHRTQHPLFYYPQSNMEMKNRTRCKDPGGSRSEDVPVVLKHAVPNLQDRYTLLQPLHGESPVHLPSSDSPSFIQGLDYPCYSVQRFHVNPSHIRSSLKRQSDPPALHSTDPTDAPAAFQCGNGASASVHLGHLWDSASFVCVDRRSPGRRASPPSAQTKRFLSPLAGRHVAQPVLPPAGFNMDRILDRVSPVALTPPSPGRTSYVIHKANGTNAGRIVYSPAVATGMKPSSPTPWSPAAAHRGGRKRSAESSPPIKIKEEDRDLREGSCSMNKHVKLERDHVQERNPADSPPMPVIDSVFSLAPYQAYLQGALFSGRAIGLSEQRDVKPTRGVRGPRPDGDDRPSVVRGGSRHARTPPERPDAEITERRTIKEEKVDPGGAVECKTTIKTEVEDTGSSERKHEPGRDRDLPPADEKKTADEPPDGDVSHCPPPKPPPPPQPPGTRMDLSNLPPQRLQLPSYQVFLPDVTQPSTTPPQEKPLAQPAAQLTRQPDVHVPVRKHFFELHRSLCKLVSESVSASSEPALRSWLSQLRLADPAPPTKVQKVSCLLGGKAREEWLNEETASAFHAVLERLREYTAMERCPFPHVMRTQAVFLPMLVVKELLFPTVQGSFVDQVLQEHRVELRPATLSEEKILIQLHKQACSSRLRRLMALKHLPDVYADVLNLLYYTTVVKHLGVDADASATRMSDGARSVSPSPAVVSPASPSESQPPKDDNAEPRSNGGRTKSRVKRRSRRMFLDVGWSDEEDEDGRTPAELKGRSENGGDDRLGGEESALMRPHGTSESSWMCPLTSEELSPSPSPSRPTSGFQLAPKKRSGMILKLRRMFSEGLSRKKTRYQAVSDSASLTGPSRLQNKKGNGEDHRKNGNFSLCSSAKRKKRSLLKIKYCPYLSACHSAEHRRRWVLRSAVQRAQRAMRSHYPDLVGKRIRHLYEEDDKSEAWYRGEVVRVHEAHSNPLQTIFEVRYDSEPEWKYYLELLIDYRNGWLQIED